MIEIGKKILSRDIAEEYFVCDLHACKGACCIEGDSGAPLSKEELRTMEAIYEKVLPYLREDRQEALRKNGPWEIDSDGDYGTTLRDGNECAFVVDGEDGIAKCGIEMAWKDDVIDFQKPISCHLYPIRVEQFTRIKVEAFNYDQWDICEAACELGKKLKVPLYKFLKEPLIRAYGEDFYADLVKAIEG